MHDEVWVVAGGPPPDLHRLAQIPDRARIVAADSGADHVYRAGRVPDIVVGDLDSITPTTLRELRTAGVEVREHPAAKDESDLELALLVALDAHPDRIVVLAGEGGRPDHQLANLFAIASPRLAGVDVTAFMGPTTVYAIHNHRLLDVAVGAIVSLFAVAGPASGVTTQGLTFALRDATLEPLVARGLSNVCDASPVSVTVAHGVLLALCPEGPGS